LHNTPFCPITASGSNFNPRNTQCIPAVEIITFLVLGQNWAFFKGLIARVMVLKGSKSWNDLINEYNGESADHAYVPRKDVFLAIVRKNLLKDF